MDAFLKASYEGDTDKFKQLCDDQDPLYLDKMLTEVGDNPLHIAALQGHVDFTREILRLKPELARKLNGEGRSPLHLAAARGHLEVAQMLVDKVGSDICLIPESNYGYLPVHIATVNGHHDVVEMLVERCNETLTKTTNRRETLLHLVVTVNCVDCVRYFIDKGVKLNEEDENGNTCLHLAAGKRHSQVITHLLGQESLKINSKNKRGLTALDILLVSSLYSAVDISLVCTMQRAGGKEAAEMQDDESGMTAVVGARPPSDRGLLSGNINVTKLGGDAQTLLIVATLVATITFQAVINPPGGFVQAPFAMNDTLKINSTWYDTWKVDDLYPAGRPVLLFQLTAFFYLNSLALFSSVSVILWLLIAEHTKDIMKFLVAEVWFSAFCTAMAFGCALLAIYTPYYNMYDESYELVWSLIITYFFVYVVAGLWATFLELQFLWRKAGFKGQLPNWIAQLIRWLKKDTFIGTIATKLGGLKGNPCFKKIIYGILMAYVVGAFGLAIEFTSSAVMQSLRLPEKGS